MFQPPVNTVLEQWERGASYFIGEGSHPWEGRHLCSAVYMTERDYRFTPEEKVRIYGILMEQKALPHHPFEADPVHVCCEFERFLGNPAVWTVTS